MTYEVRAQNSVDSFNIPLSITCSGTTAGGVMLVSAAYAPTSAESTSAIPRFADTSTTSPVFNFHSCFWPTHLSFIAPPANGIAASELPAVQVSVLDASGNLTDNNPSVTVTSSQAAVTATQSPMGGLAVFRGITFGTPGTYTLTASATGLAAITSNPFVIKAPATVTLSASPNPARFGQSVTLTATISPASDAGPVTFKEAPILWTRTQSLT